MLSSKAYKKVIQAFQNQAGDKPRTQATLNAALDIAIRRIGPDKSNEEYIAIMNQIIAEAESDDTPVHATPEEISAVEPIPGYGDEDEEQEADEEPATIDDDVDLGEDTASPTFSVPFAAPVTTIDDVYLAINALSARIDALATKIGAGVAAKKTEVFAAPQPVQATSEYQFRIVHAAKVPDRYKNGRGMVVPSAILETIQDAVESGSRIPAIPGILITKTQKA